MIVDASRLPPLARAHVARRLRHVVPWREAAREGLLTLDEWDVVPLYGVAFVTGRADLGDDAKLRVREPLLDVEAYPALECVSWGWLSLGRPSGSLALSAALGGVDLGTEVKRTLLEATVYCAEMRRQLMGGATG